MFPLFPKVCVECGWIMGQHDPTCQSHGYANVGPHPDAPPDTRPMTRPAIPPAECPCGIARLDCEYHRPQPRSSALSSVAVTEIEIDLRAFFLQANNVVRRDQR